MGLPTLVENFVDKIWMTMNWAVCKGLPFFAGMENRIMVAV